jgi:fumigallin biosynthesis monooxygenase-like protein
MGKVTAGRMSADIKGDFVVFLIGMRFNRPWHLVKSLYAFTAMPRMLAYLRGHPEAGLLHAMLTFSASGPIVIQYWRSVEHLEGFARDARAPHHPAWKTWNRLVGYRRPHVGIWHESYQIKAGNYECLYGNMPRFGLARAAGHVPVERKGDTAAQRRGPSASRT